jgi:WD40 repeat protein
MNHKRFLLLAALLWALAACADPGASTPSPSASARAAPATLRPTTPARATSAPTLVTAPPTPTAIASPAPALTATAAPLDFAPPTATPPFPTLAIDESTLGRLRPMRTIGVGAAQKIALAPDGRVLAVGTAVGVAIFELPTLHMVRFDPIDGGTRSLAFSPDGRMLAIEATTQASTELRRVSDGMKLATLEGVAPVFSPDGQIIATERTTDISQRATLLWHVGDGRQQAVLLGVAPVFSPRGTFVATLQGKDTEQPHMALWRSADGAPVWTQPGGVVAFSPDERFAAITAGSRIQLWNTAGRLPSGAQTLDAQGPVLALAFSADGALLRALVGGGIQAWDIASGQLTHTTLDLAGQNRAEQGAFAPGGATLALWISVGEGGVTRLVYTADGALIYEAGWAEDIAFSADGSTAALLESFLSDDDGGIRIVDLQQATSTLLHLPEFQNITFSPDVQTLAASTGVTISLWNVIDGALQQTLESNDVSIGGAGSYLRYTPDGRTIALSGQPQIVYGEAGPAAVRWDAQAGSSSAREQSFNPPGFGPSAWAFGPEPVAALAFGANLEIHSASDISRTLPLPATITALAFSPGGALLAVADQRGTVQLIKTDDAATAGVLGTGGVAPSAVPLLAWSPDGALLGVLRADGTMQIWRIGDGRLQATLAAAPDDTRLIFTTDGTMAITGGPRGVALYRLSDGALLHTIDVSTDDIAIGPRRRLLGLLHAGQVQLWGIE